MKNTITVNTLLKRHEFLKKPIHLPSLYSNWKSPFSKIYYNEHTFSSANLSGLQKFNVEWGRINL